MRRSSGISEPGATRAGARKCSFSQFSRCARRGRAQVALPGIPLAHPGQIGPVVAADAADLVAAAAAERVEQRLRLDEPGGADARRQEHVDGLPVAVAERRERGAPRSGPGAAVLGDVVRVPVGPEPARADAREVGPLDAALAPGPQRPAAPVDAVAREAVVPLERVAPAREERGVRHGEVGVAGPAARVQVATRQHRLRPVLHVAVRVPPVVARPWPAWQAVQPKVAASCTTGG